MATKGATMATQTIFLQVQGMTCEGCAETIERALKRHKGVRDVDVDWALGIAQIAFDPELTDEEKILRDRVFQRWYEARLTHFGSCC
jgi:copper chaperone CopZ